MKFFCCCCNCLIAKIKKKRCNFVLYFYTSYLLIEYGLITQICFKLKLKLKIKLKN